MTLCRGGPSVPSMEPRDYRVRSLQSGDAPRLADAYARNRAHLQPWEPIRPESFFTASGQAEVVEQRLGDEASGRGRSWVVELGDLIVGRVDLSNVARGVFQSCSLGYWIDAGHTGRGLATRAVDTACDEARAWGLHRVEAATVLHNAASQAVLRKCAFSLIGRAPSYLFIAGAWADHVVFQRILHSSPPA